MGIKQSILSSSRFLQRTFCLSEQGYCDRQPNRFQHYAGCFSVKEAIMKALGTGWNSGVQWIHIKVEHFPSGMPKVTLYQQAKKQADELQVKNIHISLSHTEQYATAFVILES